MPAHRRPTSIRRRVLWAAVAVTAVALPAAVLPTLVDTQSAVAASDVAPAPAGRPALFEPPTAPTAPSAATLSAVDVAAPASAASGSDPGTTLTQVLTSAGYPADPDTLGFIDRTATDICRDLAVGRAGIDVLEDVSGRTAPLGWSDAQSDGLVYIGVAAECSAYSHLLP
ncbi:hypothetical protein ACTHQY_10485 [Rhodococcoides corynebacterioides]|uniref:hypothetical protein n=1 Tax=Rhodococcoides corynebacterioides TaxID=53972 RepID=UPI003F81CBF9